MSEMYIHIFRPCTVANIVLWYDILKATNRLDFWEYFDSHKQQEWLTLNRN